MSPFHKNCIELLEQLSETHSLHCMKNALSTIERSFRLVGVDDSMAVFLGITAEEEAAAALMRALLENDYAEKGAFNQHDHGHKHAVWPFLEVIGIFLQDGLLGAMGECRIAIKKEDNGVSRLVIALATPIVIDGDRQFAWPVPPLNLTVMPKEGKELDLNCEMEKYLKLKARETIKEYVKSEANLRNIVLYSGRKGLVKVDAERLSIFLADRKVRVLVILQIYLLIAQYKERQQLVVSMSAIFRDVIASLKRKRG